MTLDLLLLFVVAVATFAFVPGPAIVYVVARTLTGGRQGGFAAAAGLHVGGYVHVVAAALGLAVLLETIPIAFGALKMLGAAYLCYLGLKMILTRAADFEIPKGRIKSSFWQSVMVEVLNPKAALFFLAFLPQFVVADSNLSVSVQFLLLGTLVNLAFSVADVIYILAADGVQRRILNSPRAAILGQRLGGILLIGLGIKLAITRTT